MALLLLKNLAWTVLMLGMVLCNTANVVKKCPTLGCTTEELGCSYSGTTLNCGFNTSLTSVNTLIKSYLSNLSRLFYLKPF